MTSKKVKDDAWAQRVLERLKKDLWDARHTTTPGQFDEARIDAILNKLKNELWSDATDPKEREAWATHIIEKLRAELWAPASNGSKKQPTPEELKRVEAILAKLKKELWAL